jgi:hypothetical protein
VLCVYMSIAIYMACKSHVSVNHLHLHIQICYMYIYHVTMYIYIIIIIFKKIGTFTFTQPYVNVLGVKVQV